MLYQTTALNNPGNVSKRILQDLKLQLPFGKKDPAPGAGYRSSLGVLAIWSHTSTTVGNTSGRKVVRLWMSFFTTSATT